MVRARLKPAAEGSGEYGAATDRFDATAAQAIRSSPPFAECIPMVVRKGPQESQVLADSLGKPSSLDHFECKNRKGDAAHYPPPHDRPHRLIRVRAMSVGRFDLPQAFAKLPEAVQDKLHDRLYPAAGTLRACSANRYSARPE